MSIALMQLLDRPSRLRAGGLLLLSAATGGLSALLLPLLLWGLELRVASTTYWWVAGSYLAVLLVGLRFRRSVPTRLAALVEARLASVRTRLFDRVRAASLRDVERTSDILTAFTRDLETLAHLPRMVEGLVIGGVMLLGITVYIAMLSLVALAAWLLVCTALVVALRPELSRSEDSAEGFDGAWEDFDAHAERMLGGFKQLKLDRQAALEVAEQMSRCLAELGAKRLRRDQVQRNAELKTDVIFSLAIVGLLFSLPMLWTAGASIALALVAALLFAEGALSGVVKHSQYVIACEVAWRSIRDLERRLAPEATSPEVASEDNAPTFESIALRDVEFTYERAGFVLGPIDLSVRRGEVVFIIGSNGCGKTTLIKLLCGLYTPRRGTVELDGQPLEPRDLERYRSLFTVISTRHYLFEKTYGIGIEDPAQVADLLERFALTEVTGWRDGAFSNLALSTGQARRLAMVVALLEDRPILVLDEWAAHQDPELRRDYYERLLPELVARGKTVIAISHDDRYFDRADRLVDLDRAPSSCSTPQADEHR